MTKKQPYEQDDFLRSVTRLRKELKKFPQEVFHLTDRITEGTTASEKPDVHVTLLRITASVLKALDQLQYLEIGYRNNPKTMGFLQLLVHAYTVLATESKIVSAHGTYLKLRGRELMETIAPSKRPPCRAVELMTRCQKLITWQIEQTSTAMFSDSL